MGLFFTSLAEASKPLSASRPTKPTTAGMRLPTAKAKQLTEALMLHLQQKRFEQALTLMEPNIRKALPVSQLRQQMKLIHRLIGPYKPGSLQLISSLYRRGKTRLVWKATFQKEGAHILLLFSKNQQIIGFMIQSPTLMRGVRREEPIPQLQAALRQDFRKMAHNLLEGYNKNQWVQFCTHCSPVMRQVFTKSHFGILQRVLMARYGKYISMQFRSAHTLTSLEDAIVVRYQGIFHKKKPLTVQFVFQKQGKSYAITGWQLR